MTDVNRRQFLRASAVAASTVGFGQAVTATASRPLRAIQAGDVPAYADWVAADEGLTDENGIAWVASLAVPALLTLVAESPEDDDSDDDDDLPLPFEAYGIAAFFALFSWPTLDEFDLAEPVLGQGSAAATEDPVTTTPPVDRYTAVSETSIYTGSFDADEIAAAIESGNAEETDSEGIYSLEGQYTQQFVAWSDEYVLVGGNREEVETIRAAGAGEVPRRYEENDDFARLLAEGGTGEYALTRVATSGDLVFEQDEIFGFDYDPLVGAVGYAQSNWFDVDAVRLDSTTVVAYADEGGVDEDRLARFGADAPERSSSRDGRFVTLETGYDESFFDDGETDDGSDGDESTGDSGEDEGSDSGDDTSDGDGSGTDDSSGDDTSDSDDGTGTSDGDDSGTDDSSGEDSGTDDGDDDDSGTGDSETDDDSDAEEDGDDDTNADDDGAGLGVLTAISGLGGAGYLLSRRLGTDE